MVERGSAETPSRRAVTAVEGFGNAYTVYTLDLKHVRDD